MSKKNSYSSFGFALAFSSFPIYIYTPIYYIEIYKLDIFLIGIILLFLRILDAILDPLIGYYSSRISVKKIKKYIFNICILFYAVSIYFLFNPLHANPTISFIIFLFLTTFFFSILNINFYSLSVFFKGEMSSSVSATREFNSFLGMIFGAVIPGILLNFYNSEKAYFIFSFFILCILFLFFFIFSRNFLINLTTIKFENEIKRMHISSLFNKEYIWFYTVHFISVLSAALPAVMIIFFVNYYLKLEAYTPLFILSYFLSAALSLGIWKKLSLKYTKTYSWLISMIFSVITFSGVYFLDQGDLFPYLLICIFSGFASGGDISIPPSLLTSKIIFDKVKTHSAVFFGIYNFLNKSALAIGSGFAFIYLGYNGINMAENAYNLEASKILILYSLIPLILKIISIILLQVSPIYKKI